MARIYKDRVAESLNAAPGTGNFPLNGHLVGYQSFSDAGAAVGDTFDYAAWAVDGNGVPTGAWETGTGTYASGNQIARTTVQESSNANAPVNFATASVIVALTENAQSIATLAAGGGGGGGDQGHQPHLYWRIVYIACGSNSYYAAAEIEMRENVGGPNVATGGTAFASSTQYNTPGSAFDGDTGDFWATGAQIGTYIGYQFTTPKTIRQIAFTTRSGSDAAQAPLFALIDYSDDGVNWRTAWSWSNFSAWGGSEQRLFTNFA